MRLVRRSFCMVLTTGAFALTAPAICQAQAQLSLQEAVDTALGTRALLKADTDRVAAAEGRKRQAGLLPNPEFEFSNENLRPGQTYATDVDTLAYVTWPLDILGKRGGRMALAEQTVNRTAAEVDVTRRQVAQRVRLAYWTARGAQERRDVLHASVTSFQRTIDYNAARLSVGTIAEQDVLRVKLEGERLQIAAHLATIEAAKARVELAKEMGRPDIANATLTEPLDRIPAPIGVLTTAEVLDRRAEIKVARTSLDEAHANTRLQDLLARPDLTMVYGFKRTQLPGALSGVNTSLAAFKITLPFLDRNQGNREAAAAELRRQEQLRAEAEMSVRADLLRASQEYAMRRAEVIETLQPLREHAATLSTIAQAAYQQGGVELLRLLDAERSRLEAESAWVDGMVAFQQSVVNLEAAQGVDR